MPIFKRSNPQQQYMNLIKNASAKWPNWDPARNIMAGDFGTLNKHTGEFRVEGNIYTHPDLAQIAKKHEKVRGSEVDHYQIQSQKVEGVNLDANTGSGNSGGQGGIAFQGQWEFKAKCGAILLMYKPRMFWVPDEFFTASRDVPILKGKRVVYQVWTCPGFYMYLSNKRGEKVTVSLGVDTTNSGAGINFRWFYGTLAGYHQQAYRNDELYTPLYCLRSIKEPWLW